MERISCFVEAFVCENGHAKQMYPWKNGPSILKLAPANVFNNCCRQCGGVLHKVTGQWTYEIHKRGIWPCNWNDEIPIKFELSKSSKDAFGMSKCTVN